MAEKTLFEQLKDVLQDFKDFLDGVVPVLDPVMAQIAAVVPQVVELLDELIGLLDKLKTEIENFDLSGIPVFGQLAEFTGKLPAFLEAAKKILPDEVTSIDAIGDIADVVTGLPSVDDVKVELLALIDAVTAHLTTLKP